MLDAQQLLAILPHRYPFLLVDRILEIEPAKRIVGLKNVTFNEPFFQGHFPEKPIMPGVLLLEAMAQTGAVLVALELGLEGGVIFFAGVDKAAFRRMVVPGDQLVIEAVKDKMRPPFGRFNSQVTVNGEVAAEAVVKFMVPKDAKPAQAGA